MIKFYSSEKKVERYFNSNYEILDYSNKYYNYKTYFYPKKGITLTYYNNKLQMIEIFKF